MEKFRRIIQGAVALAGIYLLSAAFAAQAAEYRLIIGDSASCSANGKTGPDCILPASASTSTASTTTSATSTTTNSSSGGSSTGSSDGCTVTVWNPCSNSGSSPSSSTSTTVSSTPTTTTTTTTTTSSPPPTSTTATAGTLDFGSGGYDAKGATIRFQVTGGVTALPFTVVPGKYSGRVGITPTSSGFPYDGTGVRMWWSRSKGGSPLASNCAANLKSEGFMYWEQSGAAGYGCDIPNENTTLYLNVQGCISARTDSWCSASDAKPGTTATVYIQGTKQ